jgi:secretion/DNA translocation related TadE-like protein
MTHLPARAGTPRDRGSATVWVLASGLAILLLAVAVAAWVGALLARHRAETAADLAALAAAGQIGYAADGGAVCDAARPIARSNGGSVLDCRGTLQPDGRSGTVVVRVATAAEVPLMGRITVTASARAGRLPGAP